MNTKEKILEWVKAHEREYIEDLAKLIEVDSAKGAAKENMPFGEGCAKVLSVMEGIMEKNGFAPMNDDNYVVTCDLNGQETELGILAHLDIVPVGDGWDYDPLKLSEDEKNLYGRGTADDKGPALAGLYAMRCVRELGLPVTKNAKLILGADEECGSSDIRHYFAHYPVPPMMVSPDADYPIINIEKGGVHCKGSASLPVETVLPRVGWVDAGIKINVIPASCKAKVLGMTKEEVEGYFAKAENETKATYKAENDGDGVIITSFGVNAHASLPEGGNNALTALNHLLCALPLKGEAARLLKNLYEIFPHGDYYGKAAGVAMEDEVSGKLTMTLDMLFVNEKGIRAEADCRAPICATEENLVKVMEKRYADAGFVMDGGEKPEPHYVPADTELVRNLLDIYTEYTGTKGECIAIGGGTYVHHFDNGVAFGPVMPGIETHLHGANEFMPKDNLWITIAMYAQAIVNLCR